MGVFEYVSVLTSLVVGLGIAHLLKGVASIVQHPGRNRTYWVHLCWVASMFFQAIFFWWWEFKLESLEQWTFEIYLFVLFYALLIYMLCALLFPQDLEGYDGYEDYFISRRRWFLGLLAMFFLVDYWDTWLKGAEYFASLGPEYVVSTALLIVGSLLGVATANRRYHAVFAISMLAYQVSWALRYYNVIQ
ncbi:MAG TPA: hypothetical protein VIS57_01460 [Xanthomonadales bacterium]